MATTKPPPKHPSWNPQGFTAAAGAAALMLYVVGLIAVNDYLVSYGASDFSLLRARFVYTGALAMLAPALFLLVLSLLRSWLAISRGGELFAAGVRWKNGLAIACAAAVSWTVFAVALFLATPTSSRFADAARHGVTLLIGAALAVLFGWFTWQEWNAHRDRKGHLSVAFAFALCTVVAFGYYTGKFTDDVYPIVPEQFGGGRPIDVGIVLSPAGSEALRALQPTANRTSYEGAQIVFEGEDYYIIRLPSDVVPSASRLVFRIPKSAVQVVSSVARLR